MLGSVQNAWLRAILEIGMATMERWLNWLDFAGFRLCCRLVKRAQSCERRQGRNKIPLYRIIHQTISCGACVCNRGEWIHRKRSSTALHQGAYCCDTKTKQFLAIEVTKEDVGDGKMFGRLMQDLANVADVKRVIGDGAYDSISNFLRARSYC